MMGERVSFNLYGLTNRQYNYMTTGHDFTIEVEKCKNFTIPEAIDYLTLKTNEMAQCHIRNFNRVQICNGLVKSITKERIRGDDDIGESIEVTTILNTLKVKDIQES